MFTGFLIVLLSFAVVVGGTVIPLIARANARRAASVIPQDPPPESDDRPA